MADTAKQTTTNEQFNFTPNAITPENYKTIQEEKAELERKQNAAGNEFMFQHYARLIRAMNTSIERTAKANVILERKQRRVQAKEKLDQLKAARKSARMR